MRIKVWKIGKPAHKEYRTLTEKFSERLRHAFQFETEIVRLPDQKKWQEWESRFFLKSHDRSLIVALDERGTTLSSVQLAQKIQDWQRDQIHAIQFVIGGPYGLSKEFRSKCNMSLRLTNMVLPSDMAWLILCEQVYRAHCINTSNPYHHE